MDGADFLIIGAGVAGLSAAARLARHGKVIVIEAEQAVGYHSSGRSATFSHYGIGNRTIRALTAYSRAFFLQDGDPALSRISTAAFVATEDMQAALERLQTALGEHNQTIERATPDQLRVLFPPLRIGGGNIIDGLVDREGLRLDSDALLQAYVKDIRQQGGRILLGQRISDLYSKGSDWTVATESGASWTAPILVNAAGAWADDVARTAGVRPLGLRPLRRTIIVVDGPKDVDVRNWPFVKTVVDDFYILPESGRLMASPVDEVECEPCDAQPEEYDVALAAAKLEQYTHLKVSRIAHRWAGIRTFTADRVPVAGFDAKAQGFFWLAGQGGFGLQTAPAMAEAAESLALGLEWPEGLTTLGVRATDIRPERVYQQSSVAGETGCKGVG